MSHHTEIVGDEQIGQVELFSKIFEQVDHLGLDRHIECRHRFVANDEFRIQRQRPRNPHTLALTTTHLVGVAIGKPGIEPTNRQ